MQKLVFLGLITCLVLAVPACKSKKPTKKPSTDVPKTEAGQVDQAVMSEAIVAVLRPNLSKLRDAIQSSRFADLKDISLPKVEYSAFDTDKWQQELDVQKSRAGIKSVSLDRKTAVREVNFPKDWWADFRDAKFYDCSFGTVGGKPKGASKFIHKTVFDGKFRLGEQAFALEAKQELTWVRQGRGWKLSAWKQLEFHLSTSRYKLFDDVTSAVVTSPQTLKAVTEAAHRDLMREKLKSGTVLKPFKPDHPLIFDLEAGFQFPGINIVDYDNDGDDDIFVVEQWQPCMLLANLGDGTYQDVTEQVGLNVRDANCATFADFDNDGDPDAFIGRFTETSLYFENENGKFKQVEDFQRDNPKLIFTSTATPVDFNRDGLLDLYVTTYASFGPRPRDFAKQYFPAEQQAKAVKATKKHPFLDRPGPPNQLLVNQGGRLVPAKNIGLLEQWRNSFQDVWHDFDGDGDEDLYLCNDFAPDVILKNETERLSDQPVFVEATQEFLGSQPMGFGMGASLGDYDNDGDLDVYVSNMYSKAGNRIFKHFAKVNKNFVAAARGNYLYQWNGDQFQQVAGYDADRQHVAKVGWSFGGQFADFNNDGRLDIYVPSGFFTAPKEHRADADL